MSLAFASSKRVERGGLLFYRSTSIIIIMGRNEIALYSVLGCAVILSPSNSGGVLATNGVADAAVPHTGESHESSSAPTLTRPRRAMMMPSFTSSSKGEEGPRPITHLPIRGPMLREYQRKEATRAALEREAKVKAMLPAKLERMAREAKGKLGLVGASSAASSSSEEEEEEEEKIEDAKSSSPTTHVKVHSHAAPKASEIEEEDEFDSFNPLDLFAALEGTKKTPFEKQTTASGEVIENAVVTKKDKLSSVFATMLGSMMEVSRGADESTKTNNSCVKATRNVAVSCYKEYSAINEDVKAGKLSAEESTAQMELLRETCADKSRVINTQCVKPIAEMCTGQVHEIKKECAEGIVGSEELTLNKALDSASAAAQKCATQASSLLKSCMKQAKVLSPDLKELAMIDRKTEEKAMEMKKEKEINEKVNESMKQLSFTSSSPSLSSSSLSENVDAALAEQEEVVSKTNSGEVTEEVEEVQPVVTAVRTTPPTIHSSATAHTLREPTMTTTSPTHSSATVHTLKVPTTPPTIHSIATVHTLSESQPVTTATTTTTIKEQPEEAEEHPEEAEEHPEEAEEQQAVEEEANSGCAGDLSKVSADCQVMYKEIHAKVKAGDIDEAAGKEQIAVAARQCVAKTMLATSNCVDKVQRRRLMSLAQ